MFEQLNLFSIEPIIPIDLYEPISKDTYRLKYTIDNDIYKGVSLKTNKILYFKKVSTNEYQPLYKNRNK